MPSEFEMAVMAWAEVGTKAVAALIVGFAAISLWDLLGAWLGRRRV